MGNYVRENIEPITYTIFRTFRQVEKRRPHLVKLSYQTKLGQKEGAMNQEGSPEKIIRIDEGLVKRELNEIVRGTVEETLNKLLDAEADELCGAGRYERSPDRIDTRAGSYERNLETKAGKVTLKVPKLRTIPFESAIIDRYKRRECSVEEALIEMYLAGVSVLAWKTLPRHCGAPGLRQDSSPSLTSRSMRRSNHGVTEK